MRLIVTGGCGFIGSAFLRRALAEGSLERLVNVDSLTYSGRRENDQELEADHRYKFLQADIADAQAIKALFDEEAPTAIVNFAAESHVDRSLFAARRFVQTNIEGSLCLLEATRDRQEKTGVEMRYLQVSTDEVYGDLGPDDPAFSETSPIDPRNPYSATKAGADLLVHAFGRTHKVWTVTTRASNNYGPRQYPEKLIPLMISNAIDDQPLPVYGDGKNVRDWLWVDDHCQGVWSALQHGHDGQVYNIGGDSERRNIDVVKGILAALGKPETLIHYVKDRPGHDRRYAINFTKAAEHLSFKPSTSFEQGLEQTVAWYAENQAWWRPLKDANFKEYYAKHYGKLGLKT